MAFSACRSLARSLSSGAAPATYPFSKVALFPPSFPIPSGQHDALRKGKGLMALVRQGLPEPKKREWLATLFSRRHPDRLLPGSVLTVTTEHAPGVFSGVLISVRRRGPDTSFVLRNVVQRTGVEMQFFVGSPHLKDIKVRQRAGERRATKQRRAKLFFLREAPDKMTDIASSVAGKSSASEGGCQRVGINKLANRDLSTYGQIDAGLPPAVMPRKNTLLRNIILSPKPPTSPSPPSPTFSDTTHASAINFGVDGPEKIITRAHLKTSLQAYDELMSSSANYRAALLHMSKATAAFADSLEKCSGLKGPSYEAGTRLQAASGLHHLIGNHWHVLAESLDKSFEKPLRQHLDTYKTIVHERSASYEKALREKSEIIRQTEASNMNRKQRNLQSFREALSVLQRQVDELDDLKAQHYREIMEHEEEVWNVVQAKVCVAVRSTMDMFDRFTAKASDPILEPMLQSVPDPFDSYGPPQSEDQIFTILPPLAVIANAPSPSPSPLANSPPADSSPPDIINHSWAPSGNFFSNSSTEWSDFSSPSTSPRSASPSATIKRRQSHPPSTNHHPRKSDSKLRTVLAVIDETHVQHPSESSDSSSRTAGSSLDASMNGTTTVPPPPLAEREDWGGFEYGESPYTNSIEGDETPRHSAVLVAPSHVPPYDHDQTIDPGLGTADAMSDRTIQLD